MLIIPPDEEILHAMVRDGVQFYGRNGMTWTANALLAYHDKEYGVPHICKFCQPQILHVIEHSYKECNPKLFDKAGDLPRTPEKHLGPVGVIPTGRGLFVSINDLPEDIQLAVAKKLRESGYNSKGEAHGDD